MSNRIFRFQIGGPRIPENVESDFLDGTPACSPPWYATPDTSTPGEKFFTPSVDGDETKELADKLAIREDDDNGKVEKQKLTIYQDAEGNDVKHKLTVREPFTEDFGVHDDLENIDRDEGLCHDEDDGLTAGSSDMEGLTFIGPNLFPENFRSDTSSLNNEGQYDHHTEMTNNDHLGMRAPYDQNPAWIDSDQQPTPGQNDQRPISIGQEDEFILLPAFNPDFDEIFTSLTK